MMVTSCKPLKEVELAELENCPFGTESWQHPLVEEAPTLISLLVKCLIPEDQAEE